ncbi:type IV pilus modification protein PilV [Uliginosibacterium sp. H3]|uniref:Type IV pilus modification protein PilV n=1 Tax=Uliginosibacterium silvisoli TaxID=3114758 RepID=A0ABU6JY68_9RHOO|nr:type IV pilus modification protein PilV [Uliginosibacterium sp. H3]
MSCKSVQGVSLIEVLIAVLVLSLGLLGAFKLQAEGVRQNADSKYTVFASALAHDALDAIAYDRFADRASWVLIDSITSKENCPSSSSSAAASSSSSATPSRSSAWIRRVACDLPDGGAKISCGSAASGTFNACEVRMQWTPPGRDTVSASYKMYDAATAAASSAASSH